ncbi:MAG: TrbC/VirB2 family protein [Gammaproteobacteria bacterium]
MTVNQQTPILFKNALKNFLLLLILSVPIAGYAFSGTDVSTVGSALQGLIDILTGRIARLLAILAVTGVGYGTLCGSLAVKHAVYVCLGIGIIFGAPSIVQLLGGS